MTTVIIEKAEVSVVSYEAAGPEILIFKTDASVVSYEPTPPEVLIFKADTSVMSYTIPIRRRFALLGHF